jgi:prepilin-type N-terminal cleavage/methylation domain-containing protein
MSGRHTITARSRFGFTLIELAVVLAVIVTLTLILTPSLAGFISNAKLARAHSDCPMIASAIVEFYRDNGFFPLWRLAQNGGPGLPQNRLQILVSSGNPAREDPATQWTTGMAGLLADQLVTNVSGYASRTLTSQYGWNGPYLSSEISADPWGNSYVVNIDLIDASASAVTRNGGIKAAVWVLSAGPNGIIETPYTQSMLTAALGGDDIGIRLQ